MVSWLLEPRRELALLVVESPISRQYPLPFSGQMAVVEGARLERWPFLFPRRQVAHLASASNPYRMTWEDGEST